MAVSPEDRDAMAKLMMVMEGKAPVATSKTTSTNTTSYDFTELAGPGSVTSADISAMADVLKKLNSVSDQVVDTLIVESQYSPELDLALSTTRESDSVKVGRYQIMIKEDQNRLAGKQYYAIYNTKTKDVIADDLTLYETALSVVKLLNAGKFTNSQDVRRFYELDDAYTAHKQDAIRYKRAMVVAERKNDYAKREIYESRLQASLDRAMSAKKNIKKSRNH